MTDITRIPTIAIHNVAIDNFNKVQTDLARLQDQISSGLKGRSFEEYNGQVEHLSGLEQEMGRIERYQQNNAETSARLNVMEDTMNAMIDLTLNVKELMVARNNPTFEENIAFDIQFENLRVAIAQELNTNIEGRYLFGGTRTDVPPVITDPAVPESITPGVADNTYYQGSEHNVEVRLDDGIDKAYTVRADDAVFQQLFGAISTALHAHTSGDQVMLDQAQNMLDEAQSGLLSLRSSVQSDRLEVERVVSRQEETLLYLSGVLSGVMQVDPVEAASRVAIDEATLTATFQVFARVSALRLSDFLS